MINCKLSCFFVTHLYMKLDSISIVFLLLPFLHSWKNVEDINDSSVEMFSGAKGSGFE